MESFSTLQENWLVGIDGLGVLVTAPEILRIIVCCFISNAILSLGYLPPVLPGSDYAAILADSPSDDGNILTKETMDAIWELHNSVLEIEVSFSSTSLFN